MRLFTALDLPAGIRGQFVTLLRELHPLGKLQWSPPEKLHITTTFIGEWPEARLEDLHSTLSQITSAPFPVSIRGVAWMSRRVLIAGVEKSEALAALAATTTERLGSIGVAIEDREYHPHLTLARRKTPGALPQLEKAITRLQDKDFGVFQAAGFGLFLSHGGKYTQIKEYLLSK